MRARLPLLLLSCLTMTLPLPALAGKQDQQITQDLAQLLCQRVKAGDRFDAGLFRAVADLVDRSEAFAVMVAKNENSQEMEKAGEVAVSLCQAESIAAFDKMPPRVRKAYGF